MNVFKADRVSFQPDILPDADRRQLGTPVPAPVTGCLAQVRSAGDVAAALEGELCLFGSDEAHRRAKRDEQLIAAFLKQRFHIPFPAAEHVLCMAEIRPIQIKVGDRIQPIANKDYIFLGQKIGVDGKAAAVFPVVFSHPHDLQLIIGHERVRDFAQREQVGVHTARDSGGQPFICSTLAELPFAAQS